MKLLACPFPFLCSLALLMAPGTRLRAQTALPPSPPAEEVKADPRVHRTALAGDTGYDYLTFDPAARRLYLTRGDHVSVLDADRGEPVGEIPDLAGVHGVALAPELGRGFTSNGRAGAVTIFDLKTLAKLGEAKAGANPDAILYEPTTRRVFAFNGGSRDVSVIEAASGEAVATVDLGAKPEFAVADGRGRVYVNLEDKSEVAVLDARTLAVVAHWPLAPSEEPTGLSIDPTRHRLFAGCRNRTLVILDADDGRVLAHLPIGAGVDATAFDPETARVFASNGEGTLSIIGEKGPGEFAVLENVPTQKGARTLALDGRTHHVFLLAARFAPPPPATPERPRPYPAIVPGSVTLLEFAP